VSRIARPKTQTGILRKRVLRKIKDNLRLLMGGPVLLLFIAMALLSHQFSPADPLKINARNILKSPSLDNPLGTDQLGRDILSRIIYASRVSLSIAGAAVLIAVFISVFLGLLLGYFEGWFQNIGMRLIDILVCVPEIFIAIVVVAFLGSSLTTLVLTIGFLYFPQFTRVTQGMTLSMKKREFILASVSSGAGKFRILFRGILPNISSIVIVQTSFTLSFAMLLEAGLSFLGLGVMPPQPSWGQMIGELKNYIFINPLPVIFPSMTLFLAVFSINMVGDWLQDRLNPEIIK